MALKIKFLEVMILSEQKSYTFAYSNTVDNFNNEFFKFKESLDSFKIAEKEDIVKTSTETSTEEGGGCLIATATYGSEMAIEVQQLRELRDNQLLQTESGTAFMGTFNDIYYTFSPIIADYERENPYFKEAVKLAITPMISTLSLMENAESDSEVLSIGISVIALNLGMYLGVPAIVVIGIRKNIPNFKET
jgi:peptidyl-prolyl cis-trans isomerase B (cyclophilin B)